MSAATSGIRRGTPRRAADDPDEHEREPHPGHKEGVDEDCAADSRVGAEELTIRCHGSAADGRNLLFEGTVSKSQGGIDDAVRGTFVGTADGHEIFSEECVGDSC